MSNVKKTIKPEFICTCIMKKLLLKYQNINIFIVPLAVRK